MGTRCKRAPDNKRNDFQKKRKKMKKYIFIVLSITLLVACGTTKETTTTTTTTEMNKEVNQNKNTLTGQIVKKEVLNNEGNSTGVYEYYLRCSVQDYFIKFCESSVTTADIDALKLSEFDAISVKAEIKDGALDLCPDEPIESVSRIGKYVVIYEIL
jgi:hypothetical protein